MIIKSGRLITKYLIYSTAILSSLVFISVPAQEEARVVMEDGTVISEADLTQDELDSINAISQNCCCLDFIGVPFPDWWQGPLPSPFFPNIFYSCYQWRYPTVSDCLNALGSPVFLPHLGTQATATSVLVFIGRTCGELRPHPIPRWLKLKVTFNDNALQLQEVINGKVKLTLTTATEERTTRLKIYRAAKTSEEGVLQQPTEICSKAAQGVLTTGDTYFCTDDQAPKGKLLYWPVEVDDSGVASHYVGKAVELEVK
jgi:hypothetical protein